MDVEKIIALMAKIASNFTAGTVIGSNLNHILDLDPSSEDFAKYENESIRFACVIKINELLSRLKDTPHLELSIAQCNRISRCVDFLVKWGFVPYLIPTVWNSFETKQRNTIAFGDDILPTKRYEELKFNVNSFAGLIKEPNLKKIILAKYSNILFAALCQLGLLPIAKPGTNMASGNNINQLKYEQLVNDQKAFKDILKEFILTEHNPIVIRDMIQLLANKNCQKHLKRGVQQLFTDLLLQPNGVQSVLRVACDLSAERSLNFCERGTQQWSNLIHNFYVKSKPSYINHIVPQIWELLRSKTKYHQLQFRSVAVYCIHLLCVENYTDFLALYIHPVDELMNRSKLQNDQVVLVSQCIEDLHTLFYLFKDTIWHLNPKLLRYSATAIYNIYMATVKGVYYLKPKLEDLVFLILFNFSDCKDHLKLIIFSPYQIDVQYDGYGNIQIKYIERQHQLNLEYEADLLIKFIGRRSDEKLTNTLFVTLLNMYADLLINEYSLMEKLFIVKCIYCTFENELIQKTLARDHPEIVLNVLKSILKEVSEQGLIDDQVLSISIMALRCILENIEDTCIDQLDDFLDYLPKIAEMVDDENLKQLLHKLEHKIIRIQSTVNSWTEVGYERTVDDVLKDIKDPLLPCRAHALIELKRMIESGNGTVLAQKSAVLVVIQENMKNADSYLYLSAIFTLSALCLSCPNDILPILCDEYSMPKMYNYSSETRLKIGEALMKTIRLLNETVPVHKNRLLNCFMAGVRDDDNLVRASSLSNLAEICRLLRFNLGSIIAEIVNCADYVLRFDPAVEPRRAAVFLLQLIIHGADLELLEVLQGNIKDIYKMLTYQYQCNKDLTIKLHAQVAIERLNDIMKVLFLNETQQV